MFKTILHANDGSEPAYRALVLAVDIASQNTAALHLVCVEEIPPMPEYIEEIWRPRGPPRAGFTLWWSVRVISPRRAGLIRTCTS